MNEDEVNAELRAHRIRMDREDRDAKGVPPSAAADKYGQGVWWKTRSDGWVRVADMSPTHRANTAKYMLRNAAGLASAQGFAELSLFRNAPDEVVSEWLVEVEERETNPVAWVMSTPLYRAMTA